MMKNLNDIESELLEDEALRCQVEKGFVRKKEAAGGCSDPGAVEEMERRMDR